MWDGELVTFVEYVYLCFIHEAQIFSKRDLWNFPYNIGYEVDPLQIRNYYCKITCNKDNNAKS
jgi:hypothetical protein